MKNKIVKTRYEKVMSIIKGMTNSGAKSLLNEVLLTLDNQSKVIVPKATTATEAISGSVNLGLCANADDASITVNTVALATHILTFCVVFFIIYFLVYIMLE